MKVYTEEAHLMLQDAMKKYNQQQVIPGDTFDHNYFKGLAAEINDYLISANYLSDKIMKGESLQKQYETGLQRNCVPETGYANIYLNAISQYTYHKDYIEVFNTIMEDAEEIPEFPSHAPSFPATPSHHLKIDGFFNVWLKDESYNPTGTHKDRLAWEVYLFYDEYIRNHVLNNDKGRIQIPKLSLISSGNSAIAIQTLLRKKGLPNLKVILNSRLKQKNPALLEIVERSGCEIFLYDLESKHLSSDDIKQITDNYDGIDLTYSDELYERKLSFYDWLTYEVLNLNPNYVFVPYGSGDLYSNLVEINTKEIRRQKNSKRYFGNKNILSGCHFFGATTRNIDSRFSMLYSPYNKRDLDALNERLRGEQCAQDSQVIAIPKNREDELIAAAKKILADHRIDAEESGMAGLALFLYMKDSIRDRHQKIVIINTGKLKTDLFSETPHRMLNHYNG